MTFGQECQNNAEYSEWSNELLFSLLDKQTELTLKTIEKGEKKIEIKEILEELSSPINDGFDIKKIITQADKVKINRRLKDEILERLKTANGKTN